MRKSYLWLIVLLIAIIGIISFLKSRGAVESNVRPEVLNVSASQATIAWLSKGKYKGNVSYMPAGSEVGPMLAAESFGGSTQHEVVLTGLHPSTRYTYWIGDSQIHFQFQTQPTPTTPFSFIIVWGDVSDRIVSLLRSEASEFVISLTPPGQRNRDWFSDVRPYVPIYSLWGVDSPFLKAVESKPQASNLWKLDWGGLRLVFVGKAANVIEITDMLDAPAAHTIGIITTMEAIGALESKKLSEIDATLGQTKLHSLLTNHNKEQPTRPAAFVAVIGASNKNVEIDGVQYFGVPAAPKAGAARIDIDVESARVVFIDENREVALKQPPLKQKRTCEECRRLADKGAYEESVKAYLEFIETHKDSYQIDDAYFAIADIYDSKLFEFKKALDWYRRLIAEYPNGTFTPLANQRIKYIWAYSDHDYKPLIDFERIKAIEFARKKEQPQERNKIFDKVKSLIKEYPDSNIAPVMQHWLANQYRLSDPDKAVDAYMALRNNYHGHSEAQEAMVEIGETYYDAGRYEEAIKAYNEALRELPALADTIKAQIARSQRNIRRDKIAYICWGLLAILSGATFLGKPRCIKTSRIIGALAAFVITGAILSFGAWLIHEQFNSVKEMWLITIAFSGIIGLSTFISRTLTDKFLAKTAVNPGTSRRIFATIAGVVAGSIFFLAGIFLAIYYIYIHYLIVVKL
jgi:tetratricopeptide (TPR) repeat protein